MKRVFLMVLDSFGVGEAPDAKDFGDVGSDTLKSVSESKEYKLNNFKKLGLHNIDGVSVTDKSNNIIGAYGKMQELSKGKDTTTGHWEMMGIIGETPMPTFPNGFPEEFMNKFEEAIGTKTLCNKPYSGTEVIKDYGEEHMKTGYPIIYTSTDSVFQIAAHDDIIPLEKLYEICKIARKMLTGDIAVSRVIARPFIGEVGNFTRTSNRHDYSLAPKYNVLNYLKDSGKDVISVGKITDIFADSGITKAIRTTGNTDGLNKTLEIQKEDFNGLCFINLVDFDMLYGHRNDIDGYAKALTEVDVWLDKFVSNMQEDDLLIITADHGCDPKTLSTDHSREYVPILIYHKNIKPHNLGTRIGFIDLGKTILDIFEIDNDLKGISFKTEVI